MCGKDLISAVLTSEKVLRSAWRPVYVPEKMRKQFSPLWWPCEVGASLFMCGKDLIKQFNLLSINQSKFLMSLA